MRAADLKRAQELIAGIGLDRAMITRLEAGPVFLAVGQGNDVGKVKLAPNYLAGIVADVTRALEQNIAASEQALRDMGVEP